MGSRIVFLLLACGAMTGCQRDLDVTVVQRQGKVTLVATRGDAPACVDEVRIYRAGDALNPVWILAAPDRVPCRSAFPYGRTAPGFVESGAAPRLQAGASYSVTMNGAGLSGQTQFVAPR